jgi:ectoine hydroxylase-related dioxygenase (phytanoyl-CoA dioxygenase family)
MSKIINYGADLYSFKEMMEEVFGVDNLDFLHERREELLPDKKLNFDNESNTEFHKLFYSKMNSNQLKNLEDSYIRFIKNEISPLFDEEILFQYMPSFRIQLPFEKAIHKWHYDSDDDHRHPQWEINIQIAVTDMLDNRAMWIESVPGLKDFSPMEMTYGQFAIFDGNRCTHGNKMNDTGKTRISFDFRIMPISKHEPEKSINSVTSNKKFVVGDYYRKI